MGPSSGQPAPTWRDRPAMPKQGNASGGRGSFTEASLELGWGSWAGRGRGVEAALTSQHIIVGIICHRIYVGRGLRAALSLVSSHHGGRVDREPFVGVDGDTEEAGVGLRRKGRDGLLEATFPFPGPSSYKTMTFALFPKESLNCGT